MEKVKLPQDVFENLHEVSKQCKELYESIGQILSMVIVDAENCHQPELPFDEEKEAVSLEQVRSVLAGKSRDGYTAEVRELIVKFGASRLSEIDPKNFKALLKEAEVIGNA